MVRFIKILCILAVVLCCMQVKAAEVMRADHFIEAYGRVNPEVGGDTVNQAHEVFDSLVWIAQNQVSNIPQLVVIDSDNKPWAIALPDNSVILSMGAVRICENLEDFTQTKSCLAFVLGHELAHLSNRDFWHRDSYQALVDSDLSTKASSDQEVEFKADEIGFLYASLAGYPVADLFTRHQDLFELWVSHTASSQSEETGARSQLIRVRIDKLSEKLKFAEPALILTAFEKYEDAIPLYKELVDQFPAKEFLNNLGFSYLQLALRERPPILGEDFIFQGILDTASNPELYSKSIRTYNHSVYINLLGNAVNYFERALKVNRLYLPALYNLAICRFLLGEYHEARSLVEKAIELEPQNHRLQMIRSLVIFRQETGVDMWPLTITRLEQLMRNHLNDSVLTYNTALLYKLRGRNTEAGSLFSGLSGATTASLRKYACDNYQSNMSDAALCLQNEPNLGIGFKPIDWDDTYEYPLGERWLLGVTEYEIIQQGSKRIVLIDGRPVLYSDVEEATNGEEFPEGKCEFSNELNSIGYTSISFCGKSQIQIEKGNDIKRLWFDLSG